jgi:predicted dehydrogenase
MAGDAEVEDSARARLTLATGATVSLTCSGVGQSGPDCQIRVALHGTEGSAALENIGGSFYDFRAERRCQARTEVICAVPDVWGGRAAVAWAYRLATDSRFDTEAEHFVEVASVLDRVYAS